MSERDIISRLFESRRLSEAEFQSGGSTYKTAFGRYYRDGEQITRDDYFKAKEQRAGVVSNSRDAYGDYVKGNMKSEQDILKSLSKNNLSAYEEIESQMQMLSPKDVGKSEYEKIRMAYSNFANTGDVTHLDYVAKALNKVTGGNIKVDLSGSEPVNTTSVKVSGEVGISNSAQEAGSPLRGTPEDPYFYDNGDREKFSASTKKLSSRFSEFYPSSSTYMLSKSQTCIYDEDSGLALIVKNSDVPRRSWAQIKKLSPAEIAKLKPIDYQQKKSNVVPEEDYQQSKKRVKSQGYSKSADDDLVVLGNKGDERAQEEIIKRYEKLVRHVAKDLFIHGGDKEDLVQEGLLGLVSAMRDYKPGNNKDFKQFAILSAKRNMLDAIKKANSQKNAPLNQAGDYSEYEKDAAKEPSSRTKDDPEASAMEKSDADRLTSYMKDNLTPWELEVLGYYLKGYNYEEIVDKTEKNYKSVNNAMNKVRYKLRKYKELYKESALVESILESIESKNIKRMRESYKILFN